MALMVGHTLTDLGHEVRPVLRGRGPLIGDFRAFGPVRQDRLRLIGSAARGILGARWLADRLDEIAAWITLVRTSGDVVWCNSLASLAYVRPALALGRRVVVHSHEIEPVAPDMLRRFRAIRWGTRVTAVGCSRAAAVVLARELGLGLDDVALILSTPGPPPAALEGRTIRREREVFVIGGCGEPLYAKGVDLFAELSRRVVDDRVRWRWVGGDRPGWVPPEAPIDFVAAVEDPRVELADIDLFVLTSRAESASLVTMEAMSVGTPVVAFAVGGVPEVVQDAGLLIPAGDLDAMSAAISLLLEDEEQRHDLAERARARARVLCDPAEWHASVAAVMA